MAKKQEETTALQERDTKTTAMVAPDFITGGTEGTEHFTREDVQLPRLAIAQQMSPQMNPGESAYIENLKLGNLFNTLSGQVYGNGPLEFMIVQAAPPRYIEFDPVKRGVILDFDVPATDTRTQFTKDPATGNRVKPRATKFYEYVLMLLPDGKLIQQPETIVLSLKSTGIKTAKHLNGLIMSRKVQGGKPAPLYAGRYVVTTKQDKNDQGTFGVYVIENAGWAPNPETLEFARRQFELFRGDRKNWQQQVDREPGSDDVDFPTDM